MEGLKHHRIAWLFALAHLILAGMYAVETPYRTGGSLRFQGGAHANDIGAPDERQHVNYVRHLLSGEGFPVLDPDPASPNAYENYQSHQPPVYYVLAAGVAKLTGDPEPRFGGLALRFFNGLLGASGVLGVYCFALWGHRKPSIANLAAAFAALLPMNVALSGAVSNDPLLFAVSSWTLALAARAIRDGFTARRALGIGILMGVACLTKTTAIALWPALAVGLLASRHVPSLKARQGMTATILILGLPLLLAAPWWFRNQQLYGDPLAMSAFTRAFVGSPQASDFIQELGAMGYWTGANPYGIGVGWWTLRSFFGVFGYMDIFWPSPLYAVLGVGLLGLLFRRFQIRNDPDFVESRAVRWMGAAFFTLVLVLFLRFNAQYFQGQARYLLPAIAPIATTLALASGSFAPKKPHAALAGLTFVLTALNLYTLATLPGEFARRVETIAAGRP